MSLLVNRNGGVDFNQNETPTTMENFVLWWQRRGDQISAYNGYAWGGNASTANTGTANYQMGGGSGTTKVGKLAFSTEVTSSLSTGLTGTRLSSGAVSSSIAGYACGSYVAGVHSTLIDKLTFSSQTNARVTSGLSTTKAQSAGAASATNGYMMGGAAGSYYSAVDKLIFGTDSCAAIGSNISVARSQLAAVQTTSFGYALGGFDGANARTNINKVFYSNDTTSSLSTGLNQGKYQLAEGSSSITAGYVYGGRIAGGGSLSDIDKLLFATEGESVITSKLSQVSYYGCGTFSNAYGYCLGGISGSATSRIERLNFSTEATASITSGLWQAMDQIPAVQDTFY